MVVTDESLWVPKLNFQRGQRTTTRFAQGDKNGSQNLYQLSMQSCTGEPFKSDWKYPGSRTSSQTPFNLRNQMKRGHIADVIGATKWEELQLVHGSAGANVPTG